LISPVCAPAPATIAAPKSITDYYGEPDTETLRPWVEALYDQLRQAGEQAQKAA